MEVDPIERQDLSAKTFLRRNFSAVCAPVDLIPYHATIYHTAIYHTTPQYTIPHHNIAYHIKIYVVDTNVGLPAGAN